VLATDAHVQRVVTAAYCLGEMPARVKRWTHLSLCVLDAVFSIGARYSSTTRTVWAYARHRDLPHVFEPAAAVAAGNYAGGEESVADMRDHVAELGAAAFAAQVGNRQRTSTRGGVLKAQAAHDFAAVLARHRVLRLADVGEVLAAPQRLGSLEAELGQVPGHGSAGLRVSYLWMLAGDDVHIKPDRMVLGWLRGVLGRDVAPAEAAALLTAAAAALGVTPWQVDHAVWNHQRRRRAGSHVARTGA
jgi:hypothetical protein